jgi:hypothetical protein
MMCFLRDIYELKTIVILILVSANFGMWLVMRGIRTGRSIRRLQQITSAWVFDINIQLLVRSCISEPCSLDTARTLSANLTPVHCTNASLIPHPRPSASRMCRTSIPRVVVASRLRVHHYKHTTVREPTDKRNSFRGVFVCACACAAQGLVGTDALWRGIGSEMSLSPAMSQTLLFCDERRG